MLRGPLLPLLALLLLWSAPAWADGAQYNGTCSTISWNANTEPDLAGYEIYDRTTLTATPTLISTVGLQITSVSCASLGFNTGQHYVSIKAFDTSGNRSEASAEVPFIIVVSNVVNDLVITIVNATDFSVSWTEVDPGNGSPANYDVRIASPTISWGSASSVTSGTCTSPVSGSAIGATKTCTITGLALTRPYEVQIVPYYGTSGVDATFSPLSNITGATTGGLPPGAPGSRYTIASDGFDRLNGQLGTPWLGGYSRGGSVLADLQIESGTVESSILTDYSAMAYMVNLPTNMWVQSSLTTLTGGSFRANRLLLNCSAPPTYTCYEVVTVINSGGSTSAIRKYVNGVDDGTGVSESATAWAATNVIRAESKNGVVTLYRNNAQILQYTDANPLIGTLPGYFMSTLGGSLTDNQADSFTVGGFIPVSSDMCGCDAH